MSVAARFLLDARSATLGDWCPKVASLAISRRALSFSLKSYPWDSLRESRWSLKSPKAVPITLGKDMSFERRPRRALRPSVSLPIRGPWTQMVSSGRLFRDLEIEHPRALRDLDVSMWSVEGVPSRAHVNAPFRG